MKSQKKATTETCWVVVSTRQATREATRWIREGWTVRAQELPGVNNTMLVVTRLQKRPQESR